MPTFPPDHQTNGLTPTTFSVSGPSIQEDCVAKFSAFIFGTDHNNGQAFWEYRILLRRMEGQEMTGIAQLISSSKSLVAATWTAAIVFNGAVEVTVTGALGATIDWGATSDDPAIMQGATP